MKRLVGMFLIFALTISAFGLVEGTEVMYVGGTAPNLSEGLIGHLDTTSPTALTFDASGKRLVIPYDKVQSFQYSRQLARHYGALLTVAIVMFKFRQRRHFVTIHYLDETSTQQVAVFEISKEMPRTLMAVLATRAPKGCKADSFGYETGIGECQKSVPQRAVAQPASVQSAKAAVN